MSADFSKLLTHLAEQLEAHADRDGLTGLKRTLFLHRGGHIPGTRCPTEPPKPQEQHEPWCVLLDDDCDCYWVR